MLNNLKTKQQKNNINNMVELVFVLFVLLRIIAKADQIEQCFDSNTDCSLADNGVKFYDKDSNEIHHKITSALKSFHPCSIDNDKERSCKCFEDVISNDLANYQNGITKSSLDAAAKYGTLYQIRNHVLYRDADSMFPARSSGIEHFLLKLLPQLNNTEMIINTRDYPQISKYHTRGPVFSFSKTSDYLDIMYPAWTFWAGGPAISLHPTGIGRWDLLRESLFKAATRTPWPQKESIAFFRGSRTSDERDSLVLLSRRKPELFDAKYTKNQAWKSPKDTLNAEPAKEVSFEDHCRFKYLFNFRGVAASFRFKHLFLCKSLVFHVGDEWTEFFYNALKPWVHYVPLKSYPTEEDIEKILLFFQKHDKLAQEIAERGFEFIWNHLKMEDIECYWETLLKRYTSLLKFVVKPNKDLIEIKLKAKL